jgi:tRNA modification GTPase
VSSGPDTIAALASPPGVGGIGVLRVSGPAVPAVARAVLGRLPAPRSATLAVLRAADGSPIDRGLALYFPEPGSYTGEPTLEWQGHGGPVVMDMALGRMLEAGARAARPGEFSQRAFLNGRLDLAQAEAVADLIEAASRTAARSALRSLEGEFSASCTAVAEDIADLRAYVEAGIDFPDEDIDLLAGPEVVDRLARLRRELDTVMARARQGSLLREGVVVTIVGPPNVGKSSLMNRLAGRDRAIVTEVPGTTRDALRESIDLDGLPLELVDTAGLRPTEDRVERVGIERTWQAVAGAGVLLVVVDDAEDPGPVLAGIRERAPAGVAILLVRNKVDLTGAPPGPASEVSGLTAVRVSALTGAGFDDLAGALKQAAGVVDFEEGVFMARRRHLEALDGAAGFLDAAAAWLGAEPAAELVAEDLRQAQRALGEITGVFTTEDLLERIFSSFCIGK